MGTNTPKDNNVTIRESPTENMCVHELNRKKTKGDRNFAHQFFLTVKFQSSRGIFVLGVRPEISVKTKLSKIKVFV